MQDDNENKEQEKQGFNLLREIQAVSTLPPASLIRNTSLVMLAAFFLAACVAAFDAGATKAVQCIIGFLGR